MNIPTTDADAPLDQFQQDQAVVDHALLDHALLDLEHFLPYRLSVLSNRISQIIADTYAARFGIGIAEWRAIDRRAHV